MDEEFASLKEKAYGFCQKFLGEVWEAASLKDFRFDIVQGGLSNKLYRCSLPENLEDKTITNNNHEPVEALLRIYGPIQSGQDARLREITVFTLLSEKNLGPKLYGLFPGGRLEEYIPSRSLKWNELCNYSSIGREMAKIHALKLPVRKKPLFPMQINEWLEFVEKTTERKIIKTFHPALLEGAFRKEEEWVTNQITKMDSPVVFCHNDLSASNILLMDSPRSDDRNLMLIDFEFGAYNYRGFDLANHFNTRCFDVGISDSTFFCHVHLEKFPAESEQIEFIDAYLNQLQKGGVSLQSDFHTERNKILREIPLFRLAALLYWTIGACKFDCIALNGFPYLEFAEDSWKGYKMLKEKFLTEEVRKKKNIN